MVYSSRAVYRMFAGKSVQFIFAFIVVVWLILELGWLPEWLYAPLYPFWFPTYLAFAIGSGVRNTVLPWLGSGFLFDIAVLLSIYVESVLLAGLFRSLRSIYQTYQRGRDAKADS